MKLHAWEICKGLGSGKRLHNLHVVVFYYSVLYTFPLCDPVFGPGSLCLIPFSIDGCILWLNLFRLCLLLSLMWVSSLLLSIHILFIIIPTSWKFPLKNKRSTILSSILLSFLSMIS